MKELTNIETCLVSGGIDLGAIAYFGTLATLSAIGMGYIITHSPALTKEEEAGVYAVLFMPFIQSLFL